MQLEYKWRATLIVALGLFMAILDNTVVNVALPQIKDFYHVANYNDVVWVSTAYFLAQAAVIPAVGYISDIVGTKPIFLTALALFTLGSALCVLAPSFPLLIVFRVFQGLGGGALFPIVFAITFRIFPPSERGIASAAVGVPVLLAPAFGPTIGGFLTTYFDWHAIFTVNLPIGILVFIAAALTLRGAKAERAAQGSGAGYPAPTRRNFDVAGLLLAMTGVTSLVYGVSEAGITSWTDLQVIVFSLLGIVLLVAFAVVELFVAPDPVLDLRLFKTYSFSIGNILMGILGAFFFGGALLFPIFFQSALNYSPLNSGEIFIAMGLTAAFGVFLSGRLYNRLGPRPLALTGLVLITLSAVGLARMSVATTGWSIQGWMVLRGLGFGLTNTPLQTFTLSGVNNRAMARASSLVNTFRQICAAVGVTVLTTFLAQQATTHAASLATTVNQDVITGSPTGIAAHCLAVASQNGQAPLQSVVHACTQQYVGQQALVSGINDTFTLTLVMFCAGVAIALFMGRDRNVEAFKQRQRMLDPEIAVEEMPQVVLAE